METANSPIFFKIWKRKRPSNIVEFCNSCWKKAKNAPFHIKSPVKNFHGRVKGGHRTVAPQIRHWKRRRRNRKGEGKGRKRKRERERKRGKKRGRSRGRKRGRDRGRRRESERKGKGEGKRKSKVKGRESRKDGKEKKGKGKEKEKGKEKGRRRWKEDSLRKVERTVPRSHARTHGHSGDFILCPMLCIAFHCIGQTTSSATCCVSAENFRFAVDCCRASSTATCQREIEERGSCALFSLRYSVRSSWEKHNLLLRHNEFRDHRRHQHYSTKAPSPGQPHMIFSIHNGSSQPATAAERSANYNSCWPGSEQWEMCSVGPIHESINQSINQKITTYKSDQWCTTRLKTKIKPKDNVQKVKTTQR